jgi:hypothetical protein
MNPATTLMTSHWLKAGYLLIEAVWGPDPERMMHGALLSLAAKPTTYYNGIACEVSTPSLDSATNPGQSAANLGALPQTLKSAAKTLKVVINTAKQVSINAPTGNSAANHELCH